jgi:MinD superfamily P-loop ATPase
MKEVVVISGKGGTGKTSLAASPAALAGRIRYDRAVTDAQIEGVTVVEHGGQAAEDIRRIWQNLEERLQHADMPAAMQV